jgi:hypothetical protein
MTSKWLVGGITLAMLALTGSIAYGDPPPKQGTEPGVVAHLADCTDENCLTPIRPRTLVLAGMNEYVHFGALPSVRPGPNLEPCPCKDPVCRPACQQT